MDDEPAIDSMAFTPGLETALNALPCIDAHDKWQRGQYDGKPAPGSEAASNYDSLRSEADAWALSKLHRAYETSYMYLGQAKALFVGLGRAIPVGDPWPLPFVADTLARPIVEAAARSYWITDPSKTPSERTARYLTDELYSGRQVARVTRLSGGDERADIARTEAFIADVEVHGFSLKRAKLKGGTEGAVIAFGDESRPNSTDVIRWIHSHVDSPDPAAFYSLMSGTLHPTVSGLTNAAIGVDVGGTAKTALGVTPERLRLVLMLAIATYGLAYRRWLQLAGWDVDSWNRMVWVILEPILVENITGGRGSGKPRSP